MSLRITTSASLRLKPTTAASYAAAAIGTLISAGTKSGNAAAAFNEDKLRLVLFCVCTL
jgi:hypothetical protein